MMVMYNPVRMVVLCDQTSAVADSHYGLSLAAPSPYELSAAATVSSIVAPPPLPPGSTIGGGGGGCYCSHQSECALPPPPHKAKFAYVAYSPVTLERSVDDDITCSDGDVMSCAAPGCDCDVTSPLATSGPMCLDIGDHLRHSVDFV